MQVKVRHALVNYMVPGHNARRERVMLDEIALRGEVVDIPDDQVGRLMKLGAVVDADRELERPGSLMTLPESPSDEEIIAWARSANKNEVVALAETRPELIDRLAGAVERVERDYQRQMELLGASVRDRGTEPDQGTPDGTPDGGEGTHPSQQPPVDDTPASEVVKRNAEDVVQFIAANPTRAGDILNAETVHTNGKPRSSVVRAAEAAAGHV